MNISYICIMMHENIIVTPPELMVEILTFLGNLSKLLYMIQLPGRGRFWNDSHIYFKRIDM